MAKPPHNADAHEAHSDHPPENTVRWYFHEFWPIMFFGTLFVIMCAMPLIMSSAFPEPYVFTMGEQKLFAPYHNLPPYGLFILCSFGVALLCMFLLPRVVGWFVLLLAVLALIVAPGVDGNSYALSWGPWIAVFFLGFLLSGNLFLTRIRANEDETER